MVRRLTPCPCGRTWARLEGGILGRADDMVNIKGVNVYPVGIETVVRRFAEVVEFRSIVSASHAMRTLRLEIELQAARRQRCSDCRASGVSIAGGPGAHCSSECHACWCAATVRDEGQPLCDRSLSWFVVRGWWLVVSSRWLVGVTWIRIRM